MIERDSSNAGHVVAFHGSFAASDDNRGGDKCHGGENVGEEEARVGGTSRVSFAYAHNVMAQRSR